MILLAGGIGSGKSVVARLLRLKGFGVYDCDTRASWLMEHDDNLREELREAAGKEVYDTSGRLDRKYLGEKMFVDCRLRKEVNRVVHSAVRKDIRSWLEEDKANVVVESAIGSESGLLDEAEEVWLVVASENERLSRVLQRDFHRSKEDVLRIIKVQENEETSILQSGKHVVSIYNNPENALMPQIEENIKRINNPNK